MAYGATIADVRTNLAFSTVAFGSSVIGSAVGTTLLVNTGDGAGFGAGPFALVCWPNGTIPTRTNAEIMRVLAGGVAGDTITVLRGQEGTTPLAAIALGYNVAQVQTAGQANDFGLAFTVGRVLDLARDFPSFYDGVHDDAPAVQACYAALRAGDAVHYPPLVGIGSACECNTPGTTHYGNGMGTPSEDTPAGLSGTQVIPLAGFTGDKTAVVAAGSDNVDVATFTTAAPGTLHTNGLPANLPTQGRVYVPVKSATKAFTANTTNGSTKLKAANFDASLVRKGWTVTGPGIPGGATVVRTSANVIWISSAATATATGAALTLGSIDVATIYYEGVSGSDLTSCWTYVGVGLINGGTTASFGTGILRFKLPDGAETSPLAQTNIMNIGFDGKQVKTAAGGRLHALDLKSYRARVINVHADQFSGGAIDYRGVPGWNGYDSVFDGLALHNNNEDAVYLGLGATDIIFSSCFLGNNRNGFHLHSDASVHVTGGTEVYDSDTQNVLVTLGGSRSRFTEWWCEGAGRENFLIDTNLGGSSDVEVRCRFKNASKAEMGAFDNFYIKGPSSKGCTRTTLWGVKYIYVPGVGGTTVTANGGEDVTTFAGAGVLTVAAGKNTTGFDSAGTVIVPTSAGGIGAVVSYTGTTGTTYTGCTTVRGTGTVTANGTISNSSLARSFARLGDGGAQAAQKTVIMGCQIGNGQRGVANDHFYPNGASTVLADNQTAANAGFYFGNDAIVHSVRTTNNDGSARHYATGADLELQLDQLDTQLFAGIPAAPSPVNIPLMMSGGIATATLTGAYVELNAKFRNRADLASVTSARVIVSVQTAAPVTATLRAEYSLNDGSTWATLGTSDIVANIDAGNNTTRPVSGGYQTIAAGAKAADVLLRFTCTGSGAGTATIVNVILQVK